MRVFAQAVIYIYIYNSYMTLKQLLNPSRDLVTSHKFHHANKMALPGM